MFAFDPSRLALFLNVLHRQVKMLRAKVEREKMLLTNLPDLSIQILDILKDRGRIGIGKAVVITGANRNTLKLHFKNLLEKGFIELHGQGRGAWYGLL
jgi:Fic family protein